MTYVLIVIFVAAMVANMEAEPLIAWFGPWLTLAPTMLVLRRVVTNVWRFALAVYGTSIILGVVAMEGFGMSNADSARLAGWILPPALCLVGFGLVAVRLALLGPTLGARQLEVVDTVTQRSMGLVGGAVCGALLGAFGGAVAYYLTDAGLLLDLTFPDSADEILITGSTIGGILIGAFLGVRPPSSNVPGPTQG